MPYRLEGPGKKTKILDAGHIIAVAGKGIDDTVSVEENDFHK